MAVRSRSLPAAVAIAAVLAFPAAPASAAPAAVGTISAVAGHAFVVRDGRLLRAVPAMRLRRGDRVVTRADGSARVRLREGCDVAVGTSASAVIGACGDTQVADFSAGTATRAASPGGAGAGTYAIALAGAVAAILGAAAAAQGGGQPTSP